MQHDYHNHYGYPSFSIIIIIIIMIIIVELPSTLVVCRVSFCIMFVKCNFCCANNFATRSVCVTVYLSVCMFVCLSVFLSVCMYVLLSARLPDSLLICLTVFLPLSVLALKICWLCGQKCCGILCVASAFAPWWYCRELFLLQHVIHTNEVMHTAHKTQQQARAICKTLYNYLNGLECSNALWVVWENVD